MKRTFTLWLLVFSLVFLALGGLYGDLAMLTDLSGVSLQMSEVLPFACAEKLQDVLDKKSSYPLNIVDISGDLFRRQITHYGQTHGH